MTDDHCYLAAKSEPEPEMRPSSEESSFYPPPGYEEDEDSLMESSNITELRNASYVTAASALDDRDEYIFPHCAPSTTVALDMSTTSAPIATRTQLHPPQRTSARKAVASLKRMNSSSSSRSVGSSRGRQGGRKSRDTKDYDDVKMSQLEKKRARNRVAAMKCRMRKIERISELEDRVEELKGTNGKLEQSVKSLRQQVRALKDQMKTHVSYGCKIMVLRNEDM